MNNEQIAAALFSAFERSDMEAVHALCASGFRARQNFNIEFDLETLIQFSQAVSTVVKNFRYKDIKRSTTERGIC